MKAPSWNKLLIASFIVGLGIYGLEANGYGSEAFLLAVLLLLGIMIAHPEVATELLAMVKGSK